MTTRLTKEIRAEIVDSVLAATDLQEQRKKIEDATKAHAAQLCREHQPKGWFELIANSPTEWFKMDTSVHVRSNLNPLSALDGGAEGRSYHWRIDYNDPVPVAFPYVPEDADAAKAFAKLFKEATAWRETYDGTRGELVAFLNSCSTTEKVVERMPELARHVPTKAKSYPLVAPSNVLSRLAKLGFDRSVAA